MIIKVEITLEKQSEVDNTASLIEELTKILAVDPDATIRVYYHMAGNNSPRTNPSGI